MSKRRHRNPDRVAKPEGFSPPRPKKQDRRMTAVKWKGQRLLPDLPPGEYEALRESIRHYGVRVPLIVDQHGKIIDGWHRDRACRELGLYCPREVRHFHTDAERLQVAIALNSNRRHLTRNQRRELIATYLETDPRINDTHLGEIVGVSKNTVASVRAELERTRQIDKLPMRQGRDGKERPAKYRRIIANTAAETQKALAAIKNLPASPTDKILDVTTAGRSARRHGEWLKNPELQNTETPPSLCQWIFERLETAGIHPNIILDPCAGRGNLTRPYRPNSKVIEYEISIGRDFFSAKEVVCDLAVCNPPWKEALRWLQKTVEVVGNQTPIVFICPLALFSGYKAAPFRRYLESPEAPTLNHVTLLPADTFVKVYCPGVILWLNLPELRNVALVPSRALIRNNNST